MTSRSRRASTDTTPDTETAGADTEAGTAPAPVEQVAAVTDATADAATLAEEAETADAPTSAEVETSKGGHAYLNVTGGPLMFTEQGHTVDAWAWTPEVSLDAVGRAARDAGHLRARSTL